MNAGRQMQSGTLWPPGMDLIVSLAPCNSMPATALHSASSYYTTFPSTTPTNPPTFLTTTSTTTPTFPTIINPHAYSTTLSAPPTFPTTSTTIPPTSPTTCPPPLLLLFLLPLLLLVHLLSSPHYSYLYLFTQPTLSHEGNRQDFKIISQKYLPTKYGEVTGRKIVVVRNRAEELGAGGNNNRH